MVETTNNNYKNNRRYNKKGNFRKFKNNTPMTKRGLLNFLFSFDGKVSKNLFSGMTFLFAGIYCIFQLISMFDIVQNNEYIYVAFTILNILFIWMAIAIGYKRAHSLGISGIYSIVGTLLFRPFFSFYKPERDFANDLMYKNRFDKIKILGSFFNKNKFNQFIYTILVSIIFILPYAVAFRNDIANQKETIMLIMLTILFNIVQIFVIEKKWVKKYYTNIVKVLSFISYNILIMAISILLYSLSLIIKLAQIQAIQ